MGVNVQFPFKCLSSVVISTLIWRITFFSVIAIDIDPGKIKIAKENARIYGVEDRIQFIIGDFTKLACRLQGDVVFLSPPWGGIDYNSQEIYNLDRILPPLGGENLFHLAASITNNVAIFLPKTTNSTHVS